MEIIHLAEQKKAFAPPDIRYRNPNKEAMKLRKLWTHFKPINKRNEIHEATNIFFEASKIMKEENVLEKLDKASRLINKGLFYNPKLHGFYALKGNIYFLQGKWTTSIKYYENAKLLSKLDNKLSEAELKFVYNKQLIEALTKRGNWYLQNDMSLEALSDYEQIYEFRLPGTSISGIQDTLLGILRKLQKYEPFQTYWNEFIADAGFRRCAHLLAVHAEYKIFLREMCIARHMLLKALNLDKNNKHAQDLLQVVYATGHSLSAYTVLWCMHNCYDKALVTVEKALDCNPYNPGFTLLKTIVLRLSGRYEEANSWLENLNQNFYKLLEPTADKENSLLGKFTISEARTQLIKQWYLIRYDMAMKCLLNDQLRTAIRIVYKSNLIKHFVEPYILLGDCFLKREETDMALKSYLKCRERAREMRLPISRKTMDLTKRIIDILNDRAEMALNKGHSKRVVEITTEILKILDEDQIPLHELRIQRGRALLYKARGEFQEDRKQKNSNRKCCQTAADSLKFVRQLNEDLYRTLYEGRDIEGVIDRFAPTRKLPQSLKILMQFS